MSFIALIFGGVIGAAQLTVMAGLASSLIQSNVMDAAGWLLLLVPIGALLGVAAAAFLVRFKPSLEGWSPFFGAWALAIFFGFPAAVIAPMALVGLGPHSQRLRFLAFLVDYGFIWLAMFLLFRPRHPM